MTTTFRDYQLFGREADAHKACCDNCEDGSYIRTPDPILFVTVDGTDYATDYHLMVSADLVSPRPENTHWTRMGPAPVSLTVPDEQPPPSTVNLNPKYLRTLLGCGFDICEGAGQLEPQHVYLNGEHVGWVMPMRVRSDGESCTLADAPELERIASDLPVHENEDPWVTAFRLLKWERGRAAAREGGE